MPAGKKWGVVYLGVLLLLGWFLLPVVIKTFIYRGTEVFLAPVDVVANKVGEAQDYMALRLKGKNQLLRDVRQLSRRNSLAQNKLHQQENQEHYVDRMERLLAFEPVRDYEFAYARVSQRLVSGWFDSLVIDKGSRHGLKEEMAVVYAEGLVGKISKVEGSKSTVTLVSSPSFRITVNPAIDTRPIAYQGMGQTPWSPLLASVEHIPSDLLPNDENPITLYTTGLSGSLPAGLKVGILESVEPEMEGLFNKGKVRLDEGLRSLREVAVLIPLE